MLKRGAITMLVLALLAGAEVLACACDTAAAGPVAGPREACSARATPASGAVWTRSCCCAGTDGRGANALGAPALVPRETAGSPSAPEPAPIRVPQTLELPAPERAPAGSDFPAAGRAPRTDLALLRTLRL